jgi:hypothetical protein
MSAEAARYRFFVAGLVLVAVSAARVAILVVVATLR